MGEKTMGEKTKGEKTMGGGFEAEVDAGELARAARDAARLADRSGPFWSMRLEAAGGYLSLTATNGRAMLELRLAAEAAPEGARALPARELAAFAAGVAERAGGRAVLRASGRSAVLEGADGSRLRLPCEGPEGFVPMAGPGAPEAAGGGAATAEALAEALRETVWAAAGPERPALEAVRFEPDGLAATNGAALAFSPLEGAPVAFTLPLGAARELARLLGREAPKSAVTWRADARAARFCGAGWALTTLLAAGKYPAWRKVVPSGRPLAAGFDRADALGAVRLVKLAAGDGPARLTVRDGSLEVASRALEGTTGMPMGSARSALCRAEPEGAELDALLNPSLLAAALEALPGDRVRAEWAEGGAGPLLLRSGGALALVMPCGRGERCARR